MNFAPEAGAVGVVARLCGGHLTHDGGKVIEFQGVKLRHRVLQKYVVEDSVEALERLQLLLGLRHRLFELDGVLAPRLSRLEKCLQTVVALARLQALEFGLLVRELVTQLRDRRHVCRRSLHDGCGQALSVVDLTADPVQHLSEWVEKLGGQLLDRVFLGGEVDLIDEVERCCVGPLQVFEELVPMTLIPTQRFDNLPLEVNLVRLDSHHALGLPLHLLIVCGQDLEEVQCLL